MKRRINLNILSLSLLCVLLLSVSFSIIFYNVTKNSEIASIKDRAKLVAELLNRGINERQITDDYYDQSQHNNFFTDYLSDERDTARMVIIAPNGDVLLDNKKIASSLESHGDREEFLKAEETGVGEAIRYSNTLGSVNYYYAIKLDDGNVLRMSKAMSSIAGIFYTVLPVIVIIMTAVLLIANIIARRLTDNVIRPLGDIGLNGDGKAVYDELVPYVKKIDRQKREISEQISMLKNRADTIDAITENMREGLILVDKSGIILSANKGATEIFNVSSMVGKNIIHIYRETDFQQNIKKCLAGMNLEMPFARDGKIYSIYLSPVYSDDIINGAVILFFDTTEKYAAEKRRREFSANVSHELKTPLTAISALSEMIGNGMAKEEDIKSFAMKISGQSKRLINIITDIIRLSEFDEGKVGMEYVSFDLYNLANSVITSLQDRANEKKVGIRLIGEHMQISADERLIDELLYNLVDNGIKYNKCGGEVTVTLSGCDGFCKISVSDTGIGIPKEHMERIFERFYRIDKSRSKKTGGTGLGLSIVKHIADHHGGRVEVESTEGVGTTIAVFLGGLIL